MIVDQQMAVGASDVDVSRLQIRAVLGGDRG
jgi:hypothetical protein